MLSRVANSLYWLARYLERAEGSARFLAVTHSYAQELRFVSHAAGDRCWTVAAELLAPGETLEKPRAAFWRLALDRGLPTSLVSSITRARENARGIRDAIPSEMWEELNVLHLSLQEEADAPPSETRQLSLLERVQYVSHLLQGLRDNTMARADEWHFLRVGHYLERASMTARTLEVMVRHPALRDAAEVRQSIDTLHLVATLRVFMALEAFSRDAHPLTLEEVSEFLLLDARFPRSVEFGVQEVGRSLHELSGTSQDVFSNEAEQLCGRLVAELRFAGIEEILRQGLTDYLLRLAQRVDRLGFLLSQQYFP